MQLKKEMVYENLRGKIAAGTLSPGAKLPGGLELAQLFGVGHLTVRAALKKLAGDGLVEFVNGRGTFVSGSVGRPAPGRILIVSKMQIPVETPSSYELTAAFIQRCAESQVMTEVSNILFLRKSAPRTLEQLSRRQYRAILLNLTNYTGTEPEIAFLKQLNLPVLIPHGSKDDFSRTGFSVLRNADRTAWRSGLKHLADKGFRRVALLLTSYAANRGFDDREQLQLLKEYGMEDDPSMLCKVPYHPECGLPSIRNEAALLMRNAKPEAIYCFSDFFAVALYDALSELKISVPDDVSVLGYCGFSGGEFLTPPLSTIDCDYAGAGRYAAELIINGRIVPDQPREFIMPHKLVERQSIKNKLNKGEEK